MPAVAAAASWMEALGMPMREIRKRYTKSEMLTMAWRSQELSHNMRERAQAVPQQAPTTSGESTMGDSGVTVGDEQDHVQNTVKRAYGTEVNRGSLESVSVEESALEARLGPVAKKLDEDLDLRKLTGEEAFRYMRAQGINIPMMAPIAPRKRAPNK